MQPPTFIDDRSCGSAREEPRGSADPAPSGNLKDRDTYRYIAILGNDTKGDMIMAARENNCERIESLHNNHWVDSIEGRTEHRTKAMVCEFVWRQNVGHVGKN